MESLSTLTLTARRSEGASAALARLESTRRRATPRLNLSPVTPDIQGIVALVTVTVFDVWNVDLQEQTFLADVIIKLRCPELNDRLEAAGWDVAKFGLPHEWQLHEHLRFQNMIDSITEPEGWLTEKTQVFNYRVSGKFSNPTSLEDFPFDTFHIPIEIIMLQPLDCVQFELESTQNLTRQDASIRADYAISEITVCTVGQTKRSESASRLRYPVLVVRMPARRKATHALLNGVLPTMVITGLAAMAAVLPVTQLDQRLGLIFSLVVAMVDFKQSLDFGLPKSAYNTNLDWLILVQNVGIAVAAGFSAAGYLRACRPGSMMEVVTWLFTAAPLCAAVQTVHGVSECLERVWGPDGSGSPAAGSWALLPSCTAMGLGRPAGKANSTLGSLGSSLVEKLERMVRHMPFSYAGGAQEWHGSSMGVESITIDNMSCANEAQATRSDHTLWMLWLLALCVAFAYILSIGCAARAWSAMAPEWALRQLFDRDERGFGRLLQLAGQIRRIESGEGMTGREVGGTATRPGDRDCDGGNDADESEPFASAAVEARGMWRASSLESELTEGMAGESVTRFERFNRFTATLGGGAVPHAPLGRVESASAREAISRRESTSTVSAGAHCTDELNAQNSEDFRSNRFVRSLRTDESETSGEITPGRGGQRRIREWKPDRRSGGGWRSLLVHHRQSDRSGKACWPVIVKCDPCDRPLRSLQDPESLIRGSVRCLNGFRFRNTRKFTRHDVERLQDAVTRIAQLGARRPGDRSSPPAVLPGTFADTDTRCTVNVLRAVQQAARWLLGLALGLTWAGMERMGCPLRSIAQHKNVVWVLGVAVRKPRRGEILDRRLEDILWLVFRRTDESKEAEWEEASREADALGSAVEALASRHGPEHAAGEAQEESGRAGAGEHEKQGERAEADGAAEGGDGADLDDAAGEAEVVGVPRRSKRVTRASSRRRAANQRL